MSDRADEKLQTQESAEEKPSRLDWRLDMTRVDPQVWIFLLLLVAAVLLRFWDLGARAMHHDESIHAWFSYQFYTGEQPYVYNPVYHGPLLYHITALFYFLFGDSDAIARAPEALFSLALVALCFPLRRWLGRWGWLIAAALFTFSPAFSYFGRFARHDAFVATLMLALAIFLVRYLEERRPRDLVLAAAALALSFASHELTFILAFILLSFLGLAYLLDWQGPRARLQSRLAAAGLFLLAFVVQALLATGEASSPALRAVLIALALLGLGYLVLSLAWKRHFAGETSPVQGALQSLAKEPRALLTALGVFGLIFGVLFTTFLTNPRGFLDGLVQGIGYWTGQHAVQRGDQPWFYYLMLLPVYEPIVLTGGIAGLIAVLVQRGRGDRQNASIEETATPTGGAGLFPLFLAYWAISALVLFSWAGEKMPWLLLHVALPLVLLASLALERFVRWMARTRHTLWRSTDWLIAPLFLLLALALTGLVRLLNGQVPHPLADQYLGLQAGVLIIICVGLIALLAWRIYRVDGRHLGQSFAALGLLLLSLYTVRSTFLVNFYNGDTPVELLVYTQTAPDVPLVVREIEQLSIDQTRQTRTVADPTGGHGLKIAIDTSRGAALEWPFEWYLRQFDRAGTLSTFEGTLGTPPDADILLILADNEALMRPSLQGKYTGMRLKHRWWFPEFETYKRWTLVQSTQTPLGFQTMPWLVPSTYSREGVVNLWNYFTFRRLPYTLGSQDFFLYIRNELVPTGGLAGAIDPYIEKLTTRQAVQSLDSTGTGSGPLSYPRGIALDADGNVYVADSGNNRIVVLNALGSSFSWGSFCNLTTEAKEGCVDPDGDGPLPLGAGQFNEPWGIAVDATRGYVYVADTWNHRIQAFDTTGQFLGQWGDGMLVDADFAPGGRPNTPYGFYGPRGVAVDGEGRVYVTDTGNERVLVYQVEALDGQIRGSYSYQIGTMGPDLGQFLEPVGVAVDASGWVYVADTLNGRVQVFAPNAAGVLSSTPVANWPVTGWDSTSRENKPYIAVGPGGQVYFAVPERHYVASTDNTGKVLTVWGGSGSDLATFDIPIGVAVDAQGQVYVSDSGNGRVLVFAVP
jgi:uncharacterized protein (TIGR03663 family)